MYTIMNLSDGITNEKRKSYQVGQIKRRQRVFSVLLKNALDILNEFGMWNRA